ncbi:hypothetical protein FB446DRAFT_722255 [Lentinula raphanica]|uniref:Uncharacterized protein n=1 Tax=Lentinula raphanica TaxID=153919 RepID=A0AA38P1D8_9AGAR|nr:hypothetical protein FB446DRAFT_722255 [Lentinula raphanica]KAJ3834517.1 hypothetical protein F5878DRAFT_630286 [Lentinula raphanica]
MHSLTTQGFRSLRNSHSNTLIRSCQNYSLRSAQQLHIRFAHGEGRDSRLSQGPAHKDDNLHPNDPQSQSAQAAKSQKGSQSPLDAASSQKTSQKKAKGGSGNPEAIGMVDQVGSQSSTAKKTENSGK